MKNKRIDLFDFLRGVAIFLVIINHVPYHNFVSNSDYGFFFKSFFLSGTYGVQLFYIVSALTLFKSLNDRNEKNFLPFYIRRIFRVAPIFYIGILIHLIYFYDFFRADISIQNILKNIFFINNLIPPSVDLIFGGQTIATEMNFYLILPLLFIFLNNHQRSLFFMIIYLVLLIFLNDFFQKIFSDQDFGSANFYRTIYVQLFIFLIGINLYYLIFDSFFKTNVKKIISIKIIPYIFIFFFLIFFGKKSPEFFYFRNMFIVSFLFFFIIYFLFNFYEKINKNIIYLIVAKLGRVSFSAYILHWVVVDFFKKFLTNYEYHFIYLLIFIFISLICIYCVSTLFYRLELFFINVGKNILKKG